MVKTILVKSLAPKGMLPLLPDWPGSLGVQISEPKFAILHLFFASNRLKNRLSTIFYYGSVRGVEAER